jgi:hypothetical protein
MIDRINELIIQYEKVFDEYAEDQNEYWIYLMIIDNLKELKEFAEESK